MHINKPYLHRPAYYTLYSRRLHNHCRHLQAQGYCKFESESRRHKLLNTRRNRTIRRPLHQSRGRQCGHELKSEATKWRVSLENIRYICIRNTQDDKYSNSPTPTSLTWTGLRVAHVIPITNTILAAIRRRRIATSSHLSPAPTGF